MSFIFAEHFFEHLVVPWQTDFFLSECRRCLAPGGVLRLVVPDAGFYLRCYNEAGWDKMIDARPLVPITGGYEDVGLGSIYRTKMEMINSVFRQWGEHHFAYDDETIALFLKSAGFTKVEITSYGKSMSNHQPPDLASRQKESLYVEAMR